MASPSLAKAIVFDCLYSGKPVLAEFVGVAPIGQSKRFLKPSSSFKRNQHPHWYNNHGAHGYPKAPMLAR